MRDLGDMRYNVCRLTTALLQTQDVLGNMWIGKWSMNRNWNWQLEQRLEQELGDELEQELIKTIKSINGWQYEQIRETEGRTKLEAMIDG